MPDLDERLSRRLGAMQRPVEPGLTFEALDRRRTRRAVRRSAARASLTIAVVACTVVVSVVSIGTFGSDRPAAITIGPGPGGAVANGVLLAADGRDLFEVDVETGEAKRIDGLPRGVWNAAFSPDGSRMALTVFPSRGGPRELWVANADGTEAVRVASASNVSRGSWSPDGEWIAYAADTPDGSTIRLVRPDGTGDMSVGPILTQRDYLSVSFSPQGDSLLLDQATDTGFGIYVMSIDGTGLRRISGGDRDFDPVWSPDGSRIAFTHEDGPMDWDIFVMDADGSNIARLTNGAEGDTNFDPVWAPDGTRIAYQAGVTRGPGPVWVIDPDGGNSTLLLDAEILGIAWQPLPREESPSPTPAEPEGVDVGLDFRLCDVQRLGGIDFFGDGVRGVAWTGSPLKESGRCSKAYDAKHVVAVDHDGDGLADSWTDLPGCTGCQPYDVTDLGGDGTRELVVLLQYSSTPNYGIFDVVPDGLPRAAGVYPVLVEPPGAPAAEHPGGEPLTLWAGGDEGFAAAIRCDGYPDAPEIMIAWSLSVTDYETGQTTNKDFHVTRLRIEEPDASSASAVVIETTSGVQPIGKGLPFDQPDRTCGVHWAAI